MVPRTFWGVCEISLRQLQAYFFYEHSIEIVLDFNNETHKGKKRKIENNIDKYIIKSLFSQACVFVY